MEDLEPTITPQTLRQGVVNLTYSAIAGAALNRYGFGGSILTGAKYGAGTYATVAGAKAVWDVLQPDAPFAKPYMGLLHQTTLNDDLQDWWGIVDRNAPKNIGSPPVKTQQLWHLHLHLCYLFRQDHHRIRALLISRLEMGLHCHPIE